MEGRRSACRSLLGLATAALRWDSAPAAHRERRFRRTLSRFHSLFFTSAPGPFARQKLCVSTFFCTNAPAMGRIY